MPLFKKALKEFIDIWKQEFGTELTQEQAEIKADRLLDYASTIFKVSEDKEVDKKKNL